MKIDKLSYKVYGKLIDRDIDLSHGINVFIGDNEAGKSTIFNSIASLIYGFKPTSRDKHPYVNWDRNEINFSSSINDSGELFIVERSLKSMPRLNIIKSSNNTTQMYRNETLPFINHVSEALFESVFHLTADDLNQFEKASYESLQEKLIFNYGTDYLNKISDVILQLEQDINALWRKDKRGNPKINQLQNEIVALKLQKHESEKNYEAVRSHMLRIEAIEDAVKRSEMDKHALEVSLRQMRVLMPIRELIERIDALNRTIYKSDAYTQLDAKILDKIDQNRGKLAEIEEKAEKMRTEISNLKEGLFDYTENDKKLLHFRAEIESLKTILRDLLHYEHEEHSKLDELMKLREKIGGQFKILFDSEIDDTIKSILKKLPVLDLMTLFQKYIDGFDKNVEIDKIELSNHISKRKWTIILGILGIAVSFLGFVYEPLRFLTFAGVGILGFSMAHFKLPSGVGISERVDLMALKQKIESACMTLQLPEYVYRDNSLRFFGKLEQLILLLHEEDALHEKWISLIKGQKDIETEISNKMKTFGFDTSRGAVLSLQYVLAQIDRLSEIEANEAKKQVKIDMMVDVIARNQIERTHCEAIDHDLKVEVEQFGEGDFEFGLKMIVHNSELVRKIKVYTDELSTIEFNKLDVLVATDTNILDLEFQLSEINTLEKQLVAERQRLTSEIERFNETFNLEDLNSQILMAEALLSELIEQRNQLMVLLEIVKFSDERFRVENQPNIITRVSRLMNQMTHGRYQEVLISEDNGHFELQFLIKGEIVPVSKAFSKGTIQQLFFAYRMAVLEALDPQNLLPFVLDEAFVNWDSKRLVETLKLLKEVAKGRQIFIFTCHRDLANQIIQITASNLIEVQV